MSKPRAAAILGILILCGLVVLSVAIVPGDRVGVPTSVAIAAGDPYFARLTGAFTRGCSDVAAVLPGVDDFFDICALVARAVKNLTPSSISNQQEGEVVAPAIIDRLGKELDASSCAECVQLVQDFETTLATNNTVQGLEEALKAGCEKRFSSPAQADRCRELVAKMQLPASVDLILSDFPPLIMCRELKLCPL